MGEELADSKAMVAVGLTLFSFINYLTRFFVPKCATKTQQQKWKWRNVATSFVHSLITGIWSPLVLYSNPDMCNDLINVWTPATHALVCFSIGYFLYDALDMMIYHRKRSSYELLIHHTMVIVCYSIAVSTHKYIAYGALSLMVEVNSVFLHSRQLFIICGESKATTRYKTNAMFNIGTFLLFRILTLGWMTRWLTVNRDLIPLAFFTTGSIGLAVIVVMNIILFCRIMLVDFSDVIRTASWSGKDNGKPIASPQVSVAPSALHHQNGDAVTNYVESLFEEETKYEKND
eukprot:TRINITY_DN10724_c0_g2_i3.p1 TRINITY_DN10724_c0_g2~~TRINITY_DN10724_c0_g2_i3.p1  ORF type:complete len:289 (+),score=56.02 TRINITY_DN10724_c0_g2_i3:83-949(+)